nr:ISAs1 family transposase [[Phormidium] sp. ETS-05]
MDIIAIALLAVLAGAEGWDAIETYGKAKPAWLSTFLELPQGIPSHDTFRQVFARLDPEQLELSFRDWVGTLVAQLGAHVIAIDGKTVRGSDDGRIRDRNASRNLSIFRRLSLNLLRQHPVKSSLKMKRYRARLENGFLLELLSHSLTQTTTLSYNCKNSGWRPIPAGVREQKSS